MIATSMLYAAALPSEDLIGTWEGTSDIFRSEQEHPRAAKEDWPTIRIDIMPDARITGYIGNAVLRDCRFYTKRGWLGRLLHIKTDYTIKGGSIVGAIAPEDTITHRNFTLPFNLEEGRIRGSVMVLERWKYPHPLVSRLRLEKRVDDRSP